LHFHNSRLSLDALQDFLPIDLSLDVKTVRYDTLKVAKRLEAELGEEQASFIEGESPDWDLLPPPEGVFKVGIDGGYVRNWFDKKHKFEVIVGKSILSFAEDEEDKTPSLKRFGVSVHRVNPFKINRLIFGDCAYEITSI
jgi:hypothetical protein